jgi:ribonuclease R
MIKSAIQGEKVNTEELGFIASGIRDREVVTEEAEFYMDDVKSAAFMRKYIGETFEGKIVSIISSGIFVRLNKFFVEGFVAAERMEDDYYEYYEELFAMIGRRKKKVYKLGDSVKVKVVGVNKFAGEIDFVFV